MAVTWAACHFIDSKVLECRGIDIPGKALAHWVIQCGEHFQPLLHFTSDSLLSSRIIHCNKTYVQV